MIGDQKPMSGHARSTTATYSGALDAIRSVFARTKEARLRGFGPSRFSFNNKAGACPTCRGQGVKKSPLAFLPELETECPDCRGRRFNDQTLAVTYKSKSVADVLAMSVAEASAFFEAIPKVAAALEPLQAAGLGYLTLGQASTELSGGESQRLKLALELGPTGGGRTLFLLDEPTTGLHMADAVDQMAMLDTRVAAGDTVIVIEHNLDVIASADWVIDLGPGAGPLGGTIVASGTPERIAASGSGATAAALREHLSRRGRS